MFDKISVVLLSAAFLSLSITGMAAATSTWRKNFADYGNCAKKCEGVINNCLDDAPSLRSKCITNNKLCLEDCNKYGLQPPTSDDAICEAKVNFGGCVTGCKNPPSDGSSKHPKGCADVKPNEDSVNAVKLYKACIGGVSRSMRECFRGATEDKELTSCARSMIDGLTKCKKPNIAQDAVTCIAKGKKWDCLAGCKITTCKI